MKTLFTTLCLLTCASFNAQANTPAGKTILASGLVQATNSTSELRQLKRRDSVFDVDSITTGSNSKAQFSMTDGGLIALKENSELAISNYDFDVQTQQGGASIELLKGGLRSISGAIKKNGGDYKIKTPVGSIGIRGTHFEVQLVNGDMFVAVWDGAIDLTLDDQRSVSLGNQEDFSFAQITASGDILTTDEPANVFEQTVSKISGNSRQTKQNSSTDSNAGIESPTEDEVEVESETTPTDIYAEQQFQTVSELSLVDQIAQRQGVFNYQATEFSVSSTEGLVSDFAMSMSIDFDDGTVPDGEISFNDAQGNWYAAYSGLINVSELDLAVTFASHENNLATGDIEAAFFNGLDTITGNFSLTEVNNPAVNSSGSFRLEP
ncbi:FecR domain-containing protein [Pseudoalteromonas sp. MMG010]|uniref:FecR family protein n=1 Tax=Pseudoalteromonas sp. MMG010 TaxID=2822685 RepID=UPI001B39DC47|nr:FecR family protein [Pseudoalteromonas sp. MMG010]MBQ4834214.1 FecR domain-containing protein [Pseudoalteromonas sp. MMG010]